VFSIEPERRAGLLLKIYGLNNMENGQIEQMPGMIEIDNLIKQTKLYK